MFTNLKNRKVDILGKELYQEFAVLVPYIEAMDSFLFEMRASHLRRQPNEICFPGGKIEEGELPMQAAIRETQEELLVTKESIEIVAPLDVFFFPYSIRVYPFLAKVKQYPVAFQTEEVAEIFTVPFTFFLDNEPTVYMNDITIEPHKDFPYTLLGIESYPWRHAKYPVLFYKYEDKVIWGMTAQFIHHVTTLYKNSL